MKNIFLSGGKVFLSTIIVCFISFFIVISFNALSVGLTTKEIGETVYGRTSEDAEYEELYKHYYKDGKDTKTKEYEEKGYEILRYSFRSEVSKGAEIGFSIASQFCCAVILVSFIYNELWKRGNKDFEAFRLHNKPVKKIKGFLIGLVAVIPSFILLTFFVVTQNSISAKIPIAYYTFVNSYVFEIIHAVTGKVMYWADVKIWQVFVYYALLLVIPVISFISYFIGFKDISISEKLIYKNNSKKRRV